MVISKFSNAGCSLISKFMFICFVFFIACRNDDYRIKGNEGRFKELICYYDSLSNIYLFYLEHTSKNFTNFAIDNKIFNSETMTEKEIALEFEQKGIKYNSIKVLLSRMKELRVLSIGKLGSGECDYISLGIRELLYRQMQYIIHQNFYSAKKCEHHSFPTGSKEISKDVYLFKGKSPFE
jgi:hypothetical protein